MDNETIVRRFLLRAPKIFKSRLHILVRSDLAPLDFRNTLTDVRTFLVAEPIHAPVSALNGKCAADKLILSLLGPSFGSLEQNGDLLLRHLIIIPFLSLSNHRHQQRSNPPAFPEQDVIGAHRRAGRHGFKHDTPRPERLA